VHDVLRHEFLHCRSLEIQEKQANEAAEAARKEQVILACARRDAARAAANMQQRHLEAACQLDGSAARAAFDRHPSAFAHAPRSAAAAIDPGKTSPSPNNPTATPVTMAATATHVHTTTVDPSFNPTV